MPRVSQYPAFAAICGRALAVLLACCGNAAFTGERGGPVHIAIDPTDGSVALSRQATNGTQVHHLEASTDLKQWREVAFANAAFDGYRLPADRTAYFRIRSREGAGADDWTNQLWVFDERIFSAPVGAGLQASTFAKFSVVLGDPGRVYFQDSDRYPFHFDFARARLPGYKDISIQEFVRISLLPGQQELMVGTVILPPDPGLAEVAIQFTGNEPFARESIADWFQTVRSRIVTPEGWRFLYLPAFEQGTVAFENAGWFAGQGIIVDTAARWITENACYSAGWALGRLRYFQAGEIDAAYGDGRLSYPDILVTDRVPAEVPTVSGIIALAPATPNAHVAILSRSSGIPFAFASGRALQERILALDGREVLMVASIEDGRCELGVRDIEGSLTPEQRQAILTTKQPPRVVIRPVVAAGTLHLDTRQLTPDDIDRVGGKAANFGFLRRAIPGNAPEPALSLTFDLWRAFMAQPFGDTTLGESIAADLSAFSFPPEVTTLRPVLEKIRNRIRSGADFTGSQKQALLDILQPFDPVRRIRFRSSTNVEDSEVFSGAGLYDSFSGCLADDTDGDASGPSRCDPGREGERGVFRAIRNAYASFYNENAFIERLRHGIDESQVGMALLVHHAFPDALEQANGVATLAIRRTADAARMVDVQLVSQAGANSITNPDNAFLPEVAATAYQGAEAPADAGWVVEQRSALVDAGGTVLQFPGDYQQLAALLDAAAGAYEEFFAEETTLDLDFEWKKMAPGTLVVKQVRRIPAPPVVPPPVIP